MNRDIKHIYVFDFDDTLFYTPKPDVDSDGNVLTRDTVLENGKIRKLTVSSTYEYITGSPYPHKGWWSKKETLDENIFNIKINKSVLSEFNKIKDDKQCLKVLMTGRLFKLESEVKSILNNNNLIFDEYYLNPGKVDTLTFKKGIFNKLVNRYIDIKSMTMFDDRESHIPHFIDMSDKIMKDKNISVNVMYVNGSDIKKIN